MLKSIMLASIAVVVVVAPASAKIEKQVTRTTWEVSDFPELEKKAMAVCEGKLEKSPKLQIACSDKHWPSVTKAGAFRNTGIGAELNTLMRQAN